MTNVTTNELLTPAEAAARFKVHVHTVRRWAKEGSIPSLTLPSGRRRFRADDVERIIAATTADTQDGAQ